MVDPKQAALHFKSQLEGTGAYQVTPDGQVQFTQARGGGFVPPWVWSQDLHEQVPMDWKIPASDPSSAWRASVGYDEGGPFSKHSSWDTSNGTYQGGIDWPTLLGTLGAGSLIGAGSLAALSGGGAAAPTVTGGSLAGGTSGAPFGSTIPSAFGAAATDTIADTAIPGLTSYGVGAPMTGSLLASAPSGTMAAATGGTGAAASASPLMKALAGVGGLIGGNVAGRLTSNAAIPPQLSDLLTTMSQRTQAQNPIFNAVQQGTWTGLPDYAKTGLMPPKAI